jgi:two-component system response regulator CpxR
MSGQRILLVDDDEELCELLVDYLAQEGFAIYLAHNGVQGLSRALSEHYCLIILDVMLPGMSGFEVLRRIRERSGVPVLMLTARGDDVDRIVGLEMGADDYLPKPFNPRELVARLRAILRRAEPSSAPGAEAPGPITVGDLVLDPSARRVERAGQRLDLTTVEFSLLEALLREVGQVVSREDLYRQVLGRGLSPYDRSIDVHISNLRRKLGGAEDGLERIKTVRSVGYQYVRVSRPAGGPKAK